VLHLARCQLNVMNVPQYLIHILHFYRQMIVTIINPKMFC